MFLEMQIFFPFSRFVPLKLKNVFFENPDFAGYEYKKL